MVLISGRCFVVNSLLLLSGDLKSGDGSLEGCSRGFEFLLQFDDPRNTPQRDRASHRVTGQRSAATAGFTKLAGRWLSGGRTVIATILPIYKKAIMATAEALAGMFPIPQPIALSVVGGSLSVPVDMQLLGVADAITVGFAFHRARSCALA